MTRVVRAAWMGTIALAVAVAASQTAITPIAKAQSAEASLPAGAGVGTLAAFQALVEPLGYSGSSSPLPDGTPRWLEQRASDGATAEAIGPVDALSEVTLALKVPSSDSTALEEVAEFMTQYAPEGVFVVVSDIGTTSLGDKDETQTYGDRSVHLTSTKAGDDAQVKIDITPATGAEGSGGLPTFELPSFAIPSFEIPSFAIPSFEIPSFAIPSFASDTDLAAKFPTTIDGQPVTNVQTYFFVDLLKFAGETDQQLQAISQGLGSFGIDLNSVSAGNADATVDGDSVQLSALRAAGADANAIIAHYNEIAAAVNLAMGQPAPSALPTMSQQNLGGKNVTLSTDSSGAVTYLYASGDTLWSLDNVSEDQATKILAALQ